MLALSKRGHPRYATHCEKEDKMKVYLGKYKGLDVDEIPSDYLKWLTFQHWCQEKFPNLVKEAEEELAFRAIWNKHFYQE